MLDPGTALAVTSLLFQAFAGCVEGFNIICVASNQGEDGQFLQTLLDFEEYRFVLWSRRAGLLGDDAPILDPRINASVASELLKQLRHLLSKSTLSDKYKLKMTIQDSARVEGPGSRSEPRARSILDTVISDNEKLDVLVRANVIKSGSHWPKRLWWALVDRKKFEAMVQDVRDTVDALWALLSDVQQIENQQIMRQMLATVIQLSKDVTELRALKIAIDNRPTPARQDLIGTAADLRVAKLRSGSGDSLVDAPAMAGVPITTSTQTGVAAPASTTLEDLKAQRLTAFAPTSSDGHAGLARYDGEVVFVEAKPVDFRLKGALRKRVKDIVAMLAESSDPGFSALGAKGFFEDSQGYKIVYRLPALSPAGTTPQPHTLLQLLGTSMRPSLGVRIGLAAKICRTINTFHIAGWLHKGLRSENILFFGPSGSAVQQDVLERPYLAGFNFSRLSSPTEISEDMAGRTAASDIYRDPDCLGEPVTFSRYMDMYTLGVILIEICEWWPLRKIIREVVDISTFNRHLPGDLATEIRAWLEKRFVTKEGCAFRMGDKYLRLVRLCFESKSRRGTQDEGEAISEFHAALIELERVIV